MRGAYVAAQHKDGRIIVQSWPKKRGHYQSQRQREWGEWFAMVSKWACAPMWADMALAQAWTKDTIFFPRDYLIKLARGKLMHVTMIDGTQLWNVWDMAEQIQVMLDTLSDTPGAMLYRTPTGWDGLLPGGNGQVLTVQSGLPSWQPASGGGGGGAWAMLNYDRAGSSAYSTKGSNFTPVARTKVSRVGWFSNLVAGATYQGALYGMDGSNIAEILWRSAVVTALTDGVQWIDFATPASLVMEIGTSYVMALSRTDGTDTSDAGVQSGARPWTGIPTTATASWFSMTKMVPEVGDAFQKSTSGCYAQGFIGAPA